nr:hypothetical protein [Cronobacter turicensis]
MELKNQKCEQYSTLHSVRRGQGRIEYDSLRAACQPKKTHSLCGLIMSSGWFRMSPFRDPRHRKRCTVKQSLIPLAK